MTMNNTFVPQSDLEYLEFEEQGPLTVPRPNDEKLLLNPIDTLIKMKEEAIKELNFAYAEDIEKAINYSRESNAHINLNSVCEDLESQIMELFDNKSTAIENINTEYDENETIIRENTDDTVRDLQRRHLNELFDIEKEYAIAVIQEHKRVIPKYEEMIEQSRGLARSNDFQSAKYMHDNAEAFKAKELEYRKKNIDKRYENIRKQTFQRQKNELILLNEKLKHSLLLNNEAKQQLIKKEETKFSIAVKARMDKAIRQSTKGIKDKPLKLEMTDSVTFFVKEVIENLTGRDSIPSPRGMGNKSPYRSRSPSPKSSRSPTPAQFSPSSSTNIQQTEPTINQTPKASPKIIEKESSPLASPSNAKKVQKKPQKANSTTIQ